MRKKNCLLFILGSFLLITTTSQAQNLIAVQNGGAPVFFQQVDSAIVHSHDGDTIYIPGGSWILSNPINKRLDIIGVGHNPDSTGITLPTTLIGNLTLIAGSSNGSLMGVYLQGMVNGSSDPVDSYTVLRCRITGGICSYSSQSNLTFTENIISGQIRSFLANSSATNCSFYNNIICESFIVEPYMAFTNSTFRNNIFLPQLTNWNYLPIVTKYSLVANNIFLSTNGLSVIEGISNSTVKNNLYVTYFSFDNTTNIGSNNIFYQSRSSIFIIQTGNTFNYTHNYSLQESCPGKGTGTDGTDIGIYGGSFPWKDGSLPLNPHFQSATISPTTDSDGNLNVQFKVAAQDN